MILMRYRAGGNFAGSRYSSAEKERRSSVDVDIVLSLDLGYLVCRLEVGLKVRSWVAPVLRVSTVEDVHTSIHHPKLFVKGLCYFDRNIK